MSRLAIATAATLIACQSAPEPPEASSLPSDLPVESASGQLRLLLHDAPADDVDEVWIAWDAVRVHSEVEGWVTLNDTPSSVDLLSLQDGIYAELGLATLPAGDYGQIRLDLTDSWVVVDGVMEPLRVPSGETSGVKLVTDFYVPECGELTLSLDWDVGAHLIENGQGYSLRPTLQVSDETLEERCPQPPLTELDADYCVESTFSAGIIDNRMTFVADQNGDGIPELAAGSYAESPDGAVAWFESPYGGCATPGVPATFFTGSPSGFRFGAQIAGRPDSDTLLVADRNDNNERGYVWSISDFPGGTVSADTLGPDSARIAGTRRFGTNLAIGDFDGDNELDAFITGQPSFGAQGRIFLGIPTSDTTEGQADVAIANPPRITPAFEATFADLDGDGLDELVVAPSQTNSSVRELWVIHGSSSLSGSVSWADLLDGIDGAKVTNLPDWVWSVTNAGDVDGDGRDDLLVGSNDQVVLIYGESLGASQVAFSSLSTAVFARASTMPGSGLGRTIAGLGDMNGDGFDDFAFGSPNTGEVFAVLGSASRRSGPQDVALIGDAHPTPGLKLESAAPGFGAAVRAADADGDGNLNLAVSGYYDVFMFSDPI